MELSGVRGTGSAGERPTREGSLLADPHGAVGRNDVAQEIPAGSPLASSRSIVGSQVGVPVHSREGEHVLGGSHPVHIGHGRQRGSRKREKPNYLRLALEHNMQDFSMSGASEIGVRGASQDSSVELSTNPDEDFRLAFSQRTKDWNDVLHQFFAKPEETLRERLETIQNILSEEGSEDEEYVKSFLVVLIQYLKTDGKRLTFSKVGSSDRFSLLQQVFLILGSSSKDEHVLGCFLSLVDGLIHGDYKYSTYLSWMVRFRLGMSGERGAPELIDAEILSFVLAEIDIIIPGMLDYRGVISHNVHDALLEFFCYYLKLHNGNECIEFIGGKLELYTRSDNCRSFALRHFFMIFMEALAKCEKKYVASELFNRMSGALSVQFDKLLAMPHSEISIKRIFIILLILNPDWSADDFGKFIKPFFENLALIKTKSLVVWNVMSSIMQAIVEVYSRSSSNGQRRLGYIMALVKVVLNLKDVHLENFRFVYRDLIFQTMEEWESFEGGFQELMGRMLRIVQDNPALIYEDLTGVYDFQLVSGLIEKCPHMTSVDAAIAWSVHALQERQDLQAGFSIEDLLTMCGCLMHVVGANKLHRLDASSYNQAKRSVISLLVVLNNQEIACSDGVRYGLLESIIQLDVLLDSENGMYSAIDRIHNKKWRASARDMFEKALKNVSEVLDKDATSGSDTARTSNSGGTPSAWTPREENEEGGEDLVVIVQEEV